MSVLNNSFAPVGIKVILEKEERSVTKFKNPLEANRIWINNCLVKHWLGAKVGYRPCCDICGHNDCRTVEVQGQMYEAIPAEIIIKAALSAASQLVRPRADESCCGEH